MTARGAGAGAFAWYAMSPELEVQERGPLALPEALAVIDGYFARLKPRYGSGEEALAETTFGFARSAHDFVEIGLHGREEISVAVELPRAPGGGLLARLGGSFRHERKLASRDALERLVRAYFTLDPEGFRAHLQADG